MNTAEFQLITEYTLQRSQELLNRKAREYATEDRLHNFVTASYLQGISPTQALAGMMAKHTVSIYDMCRGGTYPPEMWDEKICDHINYLILLKALVREAGKDGGE